MVTNPTAFLVDFLPVIRRTLTRTGFVIDHVRYFANVLRPWVARRAQLGKFVIRRDASRHQPGLGLGTRRSALRGGCLSRPVHPAVTLWEHRQARARLRQQGRDQVDEQSLFAMIEQMRTISHTAQKDTRKSRRDRQRREHIPAPQASAPGIPPPKDHEQDLVSDEGVVPSVVPFDDIEQW